jgi:glycosyltransferase involved in cell wall biosynthesis
MRCPTLEQLPPPPPGRTGWPWTEASPTLPDAMPGGHPWPRVTIVTPAYNHERFIEETIRSVLLQGYPDLEYFIFDDSSPDRTAEVIRKYGEFLAHWEVQPNQGQSCSINKGLNRCTGEVFNFLSSDDCLAPGALAEVARLGTESRAGILIGACSQVDEAGNPIRHLPPWFPGRPSEFAPSGRYFVPQPSTFLDVALTKKVGGVRNSLVCVMDWELYLRMYLEAAGGVKVATTPQVLAIARYHRNCKTATVGHIFRREVIDILTENCHRFPLTDRLRVRKTLVHLQAQEALFGDGRGERPGIRKLLSLAVKQPSILSTRYFWGTVRRSFSPQPQTSA